jgi:hypothetical protein
MIDISKYQKADVLRVLYNHAKPQGMGFLHYVTDDMTKEEADEYVAFALKTDRELYFDYLKGRVMKVSLSSSELNPGLYDRDNGVGAAAAAIAELDSDLEHHPS